MSNLPAIGSKWKEVDPRCHREIVVVCHDKYSGVGIQTIGGSRLTWAKPERFNGKRGGYAPLDATTSTGNQPT